MISSGVGVSEALAVIAERCSDPRLRKSLRRASMLTSQGKPLSVVMAEEPQIYPPLTVAMIQAAEQSGRLDEIFGRLAEYHEREYQLRMMLSRETFYPKVLLLAIIFIPTLGNAVVKWLTESTWAAVAYFIRSLLLYALIAALPAAALWAVWRSLRRSETGTAAIDSLKLKIPLIGKVVYRLGMARFARTLATLYAAGVSMAHALRLSGEATANAHLKQIAYRAADGVQTGGGLTEALSKAGLDDTMVLSMLRTGEHTGDIETTMVHVAEYYEDEAQTATKQMAVAIIPIAVIIAGIAVGAMMLRFYVGQLYGGLVNE
jgi:type IV pilus assembly protein PilC